MKNQPQLDSYFANTWSSDIKKYQYSGLTLVDRIPVGSQVLDVGCGTNPFKGLIPNLVGIDPANNSSDFKVSIEDFVTHQKFDVALCLGSVNFGDVHDIERQIGKIISLLKQSATIYWRCNPGLPDHNNDQCQNIPFYNWTFDEHVRLSELFGFRMTEFLWDNADRMFVVWQRT